MRLLYGHSYKPHLPKTCRSMPAACMNDRGKPNQGLSNKYQCSICHVETDRKQDWQRHEASESHQRSVLYSPLQSNFQRIDKATVEKWKAVQKPSLSLALQDSWNNRKAAWDRGLQKGGQSDE